MKTSESSIRFLICHHVWFLRAWVAVMLCVFAVSDGTAQIMAEDALISDSTPQVLASDASVSDGAFQVLASDASVSDGAFQVLASDASVSDGAAQIGAEDASTLVNRFNSILIQNAEEWRVSPEAPDDIIDGANLPDAERIATLHVDSLRKVIGTQRHGWAELTFHVDSTLLRHPRALRNIGFGASTIWLNGTLVFQDGNPSAEASQEKLSQLNSTLKAPITLREGENHILIAFSFHNVPDWLHTVRNQPAHYVRPFIIENDGLLPIQRLNKDRTFILGAVSFVLFILILIHGYLWIKSVNRYHYYAFWTNTLLLAHALTQMGDAVFAWTNSMLPVLTISHPVLFLFVLYNMIHVIGSYYKLSLPVKTMRGILGVSMVIVLYAVAYQQTLINITHPLLAITTIIFALYLLIKAIKKHPVSRIAILFSGISMMMVGAFLYVFVYLQLLPGNNVIFFLSIVLVYIGVPVTFTLTIAIEFVEIYEQMEEKVRERTRELSEKDEFKTRFFFNVSHELRTPTTILEGLLQKASQNNGNTKDLVISQNDAPLVLRNVKRLTVLVQQILELSKIDSGEVTLNRKHYRLDEVIQNAMELVQSFISLRNQTVLFTSQTRQTIIEADIDKLTTILSNLLLNASKYGPEHSEIYIQTKLNTEQHCVEIDVKDQGDGVAASDREIIFERFHRIKNPDKPYVEGIGIGLELSRSMARLHGGELMVVDDEHQGARFRLTLPVDTELQVHSVTETDPQQVAAQKESSPAVLTTINGEPIRMLLVEDNADMNVYIQRMLSAIGVVHTCKNGSEAVAYLQHTQPDIVITDLMMPVMSGEELITYMKSLPGLSAIPIIVLSAKSDMDAKLNLLRVGIVDYITKPFNADELRLKIENLMWFYDKRQTYAVAVDADEVPEEASLSDKVKKYILQHISDPGLTTSHLAEAFAMSERNFYRKIEKDSGMTPAAFIREVRLQYAARLLENTSDIRLNELANRVGYRSVQIFKRNYIERFGVSPT